MVDGLQEVPAEWAARTPEDWDRSSQSEAVQDLAEFEARAWRRVRHCGSLEAATLLEEEIVGLLLPARDAAEAQAVTEALVCRFGSAAAVLGASPEALLRVEGVTPRDVLRLRALHEAAGRLAKAAWTKRPRCMGKMADYLRARHQFSATHDLRALYLDQRFGLIADELVGGRGLANPRLFSTNYLVPLAARALELGAHWLQPVENVPYSNPKATWGSARRYRALDAMLRPLDVRVMPYVILARDGVITLDPRLLY